MRVNPAAASRPDSVPGSTGVQMLLGPVAGAEVMVTDGAQAWSPGRAMFLPIGLAGLATKTTADAAVVFPDGTVHTHALNSNAEVREAQKQVAVQRPDRCVRPGGCRTTDDHAASC
jgi:hypothetical protein